MGCFVRKQNFNKVSNGKEKRSMNLKAKKVLGDWPDLEGGSWMQRWHELLPPNVMSGTGRRDDVSCSRELDSRYDYLTVSYCSDMMCDT